MVNPRFEGSVASITTTPMPTTHQVILIASATDIPFTNVLEGHQKNGKSQELSLSFPFLLHY